MKASKIGVIALSALVMVSASAPALAADTPQNTVAVQTVENSKVSDLTFVTFSSDTYNLISNKKIKAYALKTVYLTPTGSKFHRKSCPTCSRARKSGSLTKIKRSAAKKQGYKACKVCKP